MSKWIDADAFVADSKWCGLETAEQVLFALAHQPSIDIVRCQDCKYWVYNFNGCSRNPCTEPWYATDFCNYGERNDNE